MRLTTIISIVAVCLMVVAPGALAGQQTSRIGTGSKTCTVKPGASCKGVKHLHVDLHGKNLRGAHFEKADLRKADFSFADLRGAHFEGANLRGVDFTGAKLKGANFGPVKRSAKSVRQAQPAPAPVPERVRAMGIPAQGPQWRAVVLLSRRPGRLCGCDHASRSSAAPLQGPVLRPRAPF